MTELNKKIKEVLTKHRYETIPDQSTEIEKLVLEEMGKCMWWASHNGWYSFADRWGHKDSEALITTSELITKYFENNKP